MINNYNVKIYKIRSEIYNIYKKGRGLNLENLRQFYL